MNGAGDRQQCTSGKYSPQIITSKMEDVLALKHDFLNATTAMHMGRKIVSTGDYNAGQWHNENQAQCATYMYSTRVKKV